jgi:hypothetical protein
MTHACVPRYDRCMLSVGTDTNVICSGARLFYDVQIVRILPVIVSLCTVCARGFHDARAPLQAPKGVLVIYVIAMLTT